MSSIKVTNLQAPSAASPAIVLASDGTATAQLSSLNGGALSGARNRIINGDMRFDQRNAGAAITVAAAGNGYGVDRFYCENYQSGTITIQQSSTAPTGFTNSLIHTVTVTDTPGASDYLFQSTSIEGLNMADLGWGTANAQSVTLSFWVRSSVTGTYGIGLRNSAGNRSYVATYSVNAANTWEQKSISIAGDTSGTWLTTNGLGVRIFWDLGSGSGSNGTANTWNAGSYWRTSGCVNWISNSGATFYITGVQLEAGSVATPFERRSYGQELALCQRYYEKSYNQATAPGTASDVGMFCAVGSNTSSCGGLTWKVTKRAAPIVTLYSYDGTSGAVDKLASGTKVTGATAQDIGENSFRYVGVTTTTESHKYQYVLNAEL